MTISPMKTGQTYTQQTNNGQKIPNMINLNLISISQSPSAEVDPGSDPQEYSNSPNKDRISVTEVLKASSLKDVQANSVRKLKSLQSPHGFPDSNVNQPARLQSFLSGAESTINQTQQEQAASGEVPHLSTPKQSLQAIRKPENLADKQTSKGKKVNLFGLQTQNLSKTAKFQEQLTLSQKQQNFLKRKTSPEVLKPTAFTVQVPKTISQTKQSSKSVVNNQHVLQPTNNKQQINMASQRSTQATKPQATIQLRTPVQYNKKGVLTATGQTNLAKRPNSSQSPMQRLVSNSTLQTLSASKQFQGEQKKNRDNSANVTIGDKQINTQRIYKTNIYAMNKPNSQQVQPAGAQVDNFSSRFKTPQIGMRRRSVNSDPDATKGFQYSNLINLATKFLQRQNDNCSSYLENARIRHEKLDLTNQSVVKADAPRTRFVGKSHTDEIARILTYFCKQTKYSYKQGLNELLAPLLWYQDQAQRVGGRGFSSCHSKQQISQKRTSVTDAKDKETSSEALDLYAPYLVLRAMQEQFLTNIFMNEDFNALQASMALFKLLLKYHAPVISNKLEQCHITPEMYSVSWFLTYFAKLMPKADLVLQFWDWAAEKQDVTLCFYIAVALVINMEAKILKCDEYRMPELMTSISIVDTAALQSLKEKVLMLQQHTPNSFRRLYEIKMIFQKDTSSQTLQDICLRLENYACLPLLPSELFFYAYPELIECPDPICSQSYSGLDPDTHQLNSCNKPGNPVSKNNELGMCDACTRQRDNMHEGTFRRQRFIVVDCRLEVLQKECQLPYCLNMPIQAESNMNEVEQETRKLLKGFRDGDHHICLLGLSSLHLSAEAQTKHSKSKKQQLEQKNGKKITMRDFHWRILKTVTDCLQGGLGYKYVSFVQGGFQLCHDMALEKNIQLVNHANLQQVPFGQAEQSCYHCARSLFNSQKRSSAQSNTTAGEGPSQIASSLEDQYMMPADQVNDDNFDDFDGYQGQKFAMIGYSDMIPTTLNSIKSFAHSIKTLLHENKSVARHPKVTLESRNDQPQEALTPVPNSITQKDALSLQIKRFASQTHKQKQAKKPEFVIHTVQNHELEFDGGTRISAQPSELAESMVKGVYERDRALSSDLDEMSAEERLPSQNYAAASAYMLTQQQMKGGPQASGEGKVRQGSCATDTLNEAYQGVAQFPVRSSIKSSHGSFSSNLSGIAAVKQVHNRTAGPQPQQSRPATGPVGYYPEEEKRMVPKGDTSDDFISEEGFASHRQSPPCLEELHVSLEVERQSSEKVRPIIELQRKDIAMNEPFMQQRHDAKNRKSQVITQKEPQEQYEPVHSETEPDIAIDIKESQGYQERDNLADNLSAIRSQVSGGELSSLRANKLNIVSPEEECYILNSLLQQTKLTVQEFTTFLSKQNTKVVHTYSAHRLAAKRKAFDIQSNIEFKFVVQSVIAVTPYTIFVMLRDSDVLQAATQHLQKAEIDEANQTKAESEINFSDAPGSQNTSCLNSSNTYQSGGPSVAQMRKQVNDRFNMSSTNFATVQSRFFMHDLIKITSRRSTTRIITFYFRIPKIEEYKEHPESEVDILNRKPSSRYPFATKRKQYEEVQMSFEFDSDDKAKKCIEQVTHLYKKLKFAMSLSRDAKNKIKAQKAAKIGKSGNLAMSSGAASLND